ncbi:MAG TPA: hypothetical protein VNP95_09495 [Thermomicrobiales bacterium]|nr:hypothetical protein [Thermomicrobiales bacterium]
MEGREFLVVADHLMHDDRESFLRSSIGRSYYAAYLEARSFCERYLGFIRSSSSREHQIVATLLLGFDPSVADTLRFLRRYRNTADHDIDVSDGTMRLTTDRARRSAELVIVALDAHAAQLDAERGERESSREG